MTTASLVYEYERISKHSIVNVTYSLANEKPESDISCPIHNKVVCKRPANHKKTWEKLRETM